MMIIRFILSIIPLCKLSPVIRRKKLTFWEKNSKIKQQISWRIHSDNTLFNSSGRSGERQEYPLRQAVFCKLYIGFNFEHILSSLLLLFISSLKSIYILKDEASLAETLYGCAGNGNGQKFIILFKVLLGDYWWHWWKCFSKNKLCWEWTGRVMGGCPWLCGSAKLGARFWRFSKSESAVRLIFSLPIRTTSFRHSPDTMTGFQGWSRDIDQTCCPWNSFHTILRPLLNRGL